MGGGSKVSDTTILLDLHLTGFVNQPHNISIPPRPRKKSIILLSAQRAMIKIFKKNLLKYYDDAAAAHSGTRVVHLL